MQRKGEAMRLLEAFKASSFRLSALNRKGVISIWLLLMLIVMTSGFIILYRSLVNIYVANDQLRAAQTVSRLVLSYYQADLYESYELLAFRQDPTQYQTICEAIEAETLIVKAIDPANALAQLQKQMVALGKLEVLEKGLKAVSFLPHEIDSGQGSAAAVEAIPEAAQEGKHPDARQKSIWQALRRFAAGEGKQDLEGLTEEISPELMAASYSFDEATANNLNWPERFALITYLNSHFNSKFHPSQSSDSRPLKSSEIEYIIGGFRTERQNGLYLHMCVAAQRLPLNVAGIIGSQERRTAASAMAATIVAVFPMSVWGAEAAIIGLWAAIESEVELRRLYSGQLIPVAKGPSSPWYTSIDYIADYGQSSNAIRPGGRLEPSKPGWLNYDDQLNYLLGIQTDGKTISRAAKLIDINLRAKGKLLVWEALYTGVEVQINDKLNVRLRYLDED